jgi:hypothetical protein
MAAPINGRSNDWPVWIMLDLVHFGYVTGLLDCCPYGQSDIVPDEIWEACNRIFNACKGLDHAAAYQKAKELGFVPDIPDVQPADDRIYGSINGCPVWIMINIGGGVDCGPYRGEWYDHGSPPDEIWTACYRINNACEGLGPEAALWKAKELGFVPDQNIPDFRPMTPDDRMYGSIEMFKEGDSVRVVAGPFTSFSGVVEEVDEARSRLEVGVWIFGKVTSVVLEFGQVEKT